MDRTFSDHVLLWIETDCLLHPHARPLSMLLRSVRLSVAPPSSSILRLPSPVHIDLNKNYNSSTPSHSQSLSNLEIFPIVLATSHHFESHQENVARLIEARPPRSVEFGFRRVYWLFLLIFDFQFPPISNCFQGTNHISHWKVPKTYH